MKYKAVIVQRIVNLYCVNTTQNQLTGEAIYSEIIVYISSSSLSTPLIFEFRPSLYWLWYTLSGGCCR